MKEITKDIKGWLDGKSSLYSELMEEPITRRRVVYIHLTAVSMMAAAVLVDACYLLSAVFAACAVFFGKKIYS